MHEIWRLQHFLGVVEARSFHGAARAMNISQPALTKSIRLLEESFGAPLFLRLPRGIRLTEAGELMQRRAREIEASWNAAIIEVGAQSTGLSGTMRIGGGPVYSTVFFPDMLAEMHRRFPKLQLQVATGVGSELLPLLKTGDIRAYAGGVPGEEMALGDSFETEILYQQQNAVYAASNHPLFERDQIRPEDSAAYPWLSLFSGQQANNRIQRYFDRQGLKAPWLALQSYSLQIAFKMIREHEFIACMPMPLADSLPELGLREIVLDGFRWSIPTGITCHRASMDFAPITQMIRSLRKLTAFLHPQVSADCV